MSVRDKFALLRQASVHYLMRAAQEDPRIVGAIYRHKLHEQLGLTLEEPK